MQRDEQDSTLGGKPAHVYYCSRLKRTKIVNKKFVDDAISGIDVSDQIKDKLSKSGDTANGDYDFIGDCLF